MTDESLASALLRLKELLPTDLGSAEIREAYARSILERSVFSARMLAADYLDTIRSTCADMLNGALSQSAARDVLEEKLEQLGFSMDDPSLENHGSLRRINLVIDTQTAMAASIARLAEQTPAVERLYPAWRLTRLEPRSVPREDWKKRWIAAGDATGWQGACKPLADADFVALKSSPIWQALGDGAGGFSDTLGNPYPPFAFGSGLGWLDVSADEAASLGLDAAGADDRDALGQFASLDPAELIDSARRHGLIV